MFNFEAKEILTFCSFNAHHMGLALCCVLANCKVQGHFLLSHNTTDLHRTYT